MVSKDSFYVNLVGKFRDVCTFFVLRWPSNEPIDADGTCLLISHPCLSETRTAPNAAKVVWGLIEAEYSGGEVTSNLRSVLLSGLFLPLFPRCTP